MKEVHHLTNLLDKEFPSVQLGEDISEHAVTDDTRDLLNPAFLSLKSNLMLRGQSEFRQVSTAVFITETVVEKILAFNEPQFLFTHHAFDYYEDDRGILPISRECLLRLLEKGHSVFSAHAGLDIHPLYGTSLSLANRIGITVDEGFFDYFGKPVAFTAKIPAIDFEDFSIHVQKCLERPYLTKVFHRKGVKKIAIAAGGGDLPAVLQKAHDLGCDTFLTGTVEHRWGLEPVQNNNRLFHELNESLGLNLIGGTHFATERPALIVVLEYFRNLGLEAEYIEDEVLLNAR